MESTTLHPELERLLTHQDWLRSLARRLVGDAAAAEDLVQETWMAAMKSPPDPNRPARPWLAGVVRRLASMRARGEGRRAYRQTEVARPDILPSTADLVEEVDTQRRLVAAVLELSEPYRTTVMLRYFQNMSSAEIARHQGVPAGTVRWRLKRGLDELRARLDDSFGSRDNWCMALLPLAKMSLGTGAATGVSGGTVAGTMALLTKIAAGILAVWGLFEISPLLASKARLVWASTPSSELVSLVPEVPVIEGTDPTEVASEVVERDSVVPAARRVRFLSGNREPVKGLLVALDDGQDLAPIAETNALGEVEFVTALQTGDLYIQQENSFLRRLSVEFTAVGVDVQLVSGAQLTGRVLAGEGEQIDSLAIADLEVRLDSDQILWEDGSLPRGIAARFEQASWILARTDALGAFRFENLPQDWSGKLWLPAGVVVHGADRREKSGRFVYFDGPHSDAIVSVQRLPRLKGRALSSDGKPVAGAKVKCWMDGAEAPLMGSTAEDGTFEVQLDSDGQSGMRVDLASGDDQSRRTLKFAGGQMPEGFDLGDVYLSTIAAIRFQTVDPNGAGIAGARVVQDGLYLGGQATDADGFGEVQLPADAGPCTVHAYGFQPLPLPVAQGENMRLELSPAAMVTWHVVDDRGHSLKGATLRIRSGLRLFEDGEVYSPAPLDRVQSKGTFVGVGSSNGQAFADFLADESGLLQLSNLVLGAPIWVEVLDRVGQPIHSARLGAFVPGERRSETIAVSGRLHGFHGLVHDRADHVLVGVEIELTDLEGNTFRTLSGLDGLVLFQGLAGSRYDLTVRKRGFVTQTIAGLSFSDGTGASMDKPYEIVLDRASDMSVLVVSGANVPVSGGRIVAQRLSDGQSFEASPIGGADQTLEDLDQGLIELTLSLGGVEYTETANPHLNKVVEFRVPAHGSAQVNWSLPETLDPKLDLALVATALDVEGDVLADRAPVRIHIGDRTGGQGVTSFPALLPGNYTIVLEGPGAVLEGEDGAEVGPRKALTSPVRILVGLKEPATIDVRL